MKKIAFILGLLCLVSCKDKQVEDTATTEVDTTEFGRQIEVTNEQVLLLPEAREYAAQWIEYITAQNEIENFKNATLREVMDNAAPLAEIMASLQNSVPDSLRSTAVESRLNVLTTKSLLLNHAASKRKPDPEEIEEIAEEIPSEFNYLKIQMNENFLKTLQDFEDELDLPQEEEEEENDSVSIRSRRILNDS
ncbi:hypothetical protein RM549_13890 [Salegentibacter sp. F188]|uniref:Lipoprotein n=1 Tax=Autumnicola patrickiae TaxID=3075591 RepID=A0ABU3E4M0_9FLAO|nr:hypothetical protein [Salegentibacter sp. F188]MDT0690885.1 hypothetical protein [Salegentibacter sp. F188]